jgi:hypothetical protein
VAPGVDLTDLQNVVGKYADQHRMIVAAGPITAAAVVRTFTKNKMVTMAVVGGGAWFAIHELAGTAMRLMQEQFGYLYSLLGG